MNKLKQISKLVNKISKLEFKISKVENKIGQKENISNDLKFLRNMLDIYDNYKIEKNPETMILRHYRYCTIDIDKLGE